MTRPKRNDEPINVTKQELLRLLTEEDALKKLMQTSLQEVLEAKMEKLCAPANVSARPAAWATAAATMAARW